MQIHYYTKHANVNGNYKNDLIYIDKDSVVYYMSKFDLYEWINPNRQHVDVQFQ